MKEAGQIWQYQQQHGIDFAKKGPEGHMLVRLSKKEEAKLKKMLEPVADQYIAKLNERGLPGKKLVNSASKIVAKYNKLKYEPWKP